jgi:hypothetical protein
LFGGYLPAKQKSVLCELCVPVVKIFFAQGDIDTTEGSMAEEEKGFVIKDRRTFSSETGEPKPEEGKKEVPKGRSADSKEKAKEQKSDAGDEVQLPEVNFATFVFSLSSSALLHFGEVPDPATGTKQKSLPLAKHTIDILAMLDEKTKGNLTSDEEQLLKNILYDLRMRYVKEKA